MLGGMIFGKAGWLIVNYAFMILIPMIPLIVSMIQIPVEVWFKKKIFFFQEFW